MRLCMSCELLADGVRFLLDARMATCLQVPKPEQQQPYLAISQRINAHAYDAHVTVSPIPPVDHQLSAVRGPLMAHDVMIVWSVPARIFYNMHRLLRCQSEEADMPIPI